MFGLFNSFANVIAMQPDPVQISKIFWFETLSNTDNAILINVSVSGRGIKTSY